ncbi:hypothetical protein KC19_6G093100 [Ceratodon purpureus]|uniref:Uncharacterized protein n=1 Tax=Ceratodon purpureus TaxID=3225 RepID=A0A8T0HIJ8_CERPU|nr:hypothetical protein KC19_6G093100 [Ceratodon purpureus]
MRSFTKLPQFSVLNRVHVNALNTVPTPPRCNGAILRYQHSCSMDPKREHCTHSSRSLMTVLSIERSFHLDQGSRSACSVGRYRGLRCLCSLLQMVVFRRSESVLFASTR